MLEAAGGYDKGLEPPLGPRPGQRHLVDNVESSRAKQVAALCALAVALALVVVPSSAAQTPGCTPVEAVFYESSDWARLATGLAADPSPCASYYVTIPALAADKTQMRPGAAAQVRALGSNFHALAEVQYTAWQSWVASTGNSWYDAGVEARARMTAAGFDFTAGDTWVVNEFSSAVVAGTGTARQNVRDLVRGLFYGDSSQTAAKGMVFVVGTGQSDLGLPQEKASLESWFQDQNFWDDMTSYVSDFFQEGYGDVRNYAVAGVDPLARANSLNAFLDHPLMLAEASGAPPAEVGARNYLSAAYGALANASWGWGASYGWTKVSPDVMADFISAETYAMRLTGAVRIGFAWNPLNSSGLSSSDYAAQVAGVLARLAGSIHETDGGNPAQACEATGCAGVLDGATSANGWNSFASWSPTAAVFTGQPVSMGTGTASAPIALRLRSGAANTTLPVPSTVTISSSSATATFGVDPVGPWTPSLTLTIPPGSGTATFYAQDTSAGSPTFTTNLGGQIATQVETIVAPNLPTTVAAAPPPPSARIAAIELLPQQGRLHVGLQIVGDAGQPLQGRVTLALVADTTTVASTSGQTDSAGRLGLTASSRLALGCYSARVEALAVPGYRWDGIVPASTYCIRVLPAHVATAAFGRRNGRLHVGVRATDDSGRPLEARVAFSVVRDGSTFAATVGRTDSAGWLALTARPKLAPGCYRASVSGLSASGYAWDRVSPVQRYCVG